MSKAMQGESWPRWRVESFVLFLGNLGELLNSNAQDKRLAKWIGYVGLHSSRHNPTLRTSTAKDR
eukprot:1142845-Pelagomonas_calceolata.AAC.1